MRFSLLIFDWDGTLADSAGHIVQSMQQAITALDLPPRSDQAIRELIGLGPLDAMGRLFPELPVEQVLRLLAEHRRSAPTSLAPEAPLFDGAHQALSQLREAGYRLAVATGKYRPGLNRSFSVHPFLQAMFSATRCADESADKPDPLMLRQILDETGVPAGQALMIGDTEFDMNMARALGMPAVGVSCGVHDAGRLLRAGAEAVLENVSGLPNWLSAAR